MSDYIRKLRKLIGKRSNNNVRGKRTVRMRYVGDISDADILII